MHENSLDQIKDILMSLNWKNDPDLSSKSDMDYLQDLIESLTSLLHSTPEDKVLLFRRGNAYLDKGKYEEAILDYSAIIGMDPSDSISLNIFMASIMHIIWPTLIVSPSDIKGITPGFEDV